MDLEYSETTRTQQILNALIGGILGLLNALYFNVPLWGAIIIGLVCAVAAFLAGPTVLALIKKVWRDFF